MGNMFVAQSRLGNTFFFFLTPEKRAFAEFDRKGGNMFKFGPVVIRCVPCFDKANIGSVKSRGAKLRFQGDFHVSVL